MKLIKDTNSTVVFRCEDLFNRRKSITFSNSGQMMVFLKFYNYTLTQIYNINVGVTELYYSLEQKCAKWFYNKVSQVFGNQSDIVFYTQFEDHLFYIHMYNPQVYNVEVIYKLDGLNFINTFEMIQQKHEIYKLYKRFIEAFKTMSIEEIKTTFIEDKGNNEYLSNLFILNYKQIVTSLSAKFIKINV